MATLITVHGTFAHSSSSHHPAEAATDAERQWWQAESAFERDIRGLVAARDGQLEVTRFEWSGDNSEVGRRAAGAKLFKELRQLEARNEPYCVVGHSHGGSVVSAALLESAARKEPLDNLKRWITVGTPFVKLEKERWLFARLDLMRKVVFVGSMMLLLMFLVYLVADLASGQRMLFGSTFPQILIATGVMMSLPAIVFYIVLHVLDRRSLLLYRRKVTDRARKTFGARWLSLAHTDDEAIQGLAFLPGAKLSFFDRHFAVPTITIVSVVALPLLYLAVLTSPPIMSGVADWLKTSIYESRSSPEAEAALQNLRRGLREARTRSGPPGAGRGDDRMSEERRAVWRDFRNQRRELQQRFPNLDSAERALRFNQRFFEHDDKPCEGGKLCGGGRDLRINAGLLLHVATDELSWALGASEASNWRDRQIWSLVAPALLLPLIFGLLSLLLMLVIRGIAIVISRTTSHMLNSMTNIEVKRAAFGNDTEGEIAVGAIDRPIWLDRSPPRLPGALGDLVTTYSNTVASQSLSKFRRAIGRIASADPQHTADSAITTYFTWKELVHSAYFDVPEFRKLVAVAVSRTDGFVATPGFEADPDFRRAAQWLAEIEGDPGTTAPVGQGGPTPADAGAVSAVVASTVKAEP